MSNYKIYELKVQSGPALANCKIPVIADLMKRFAPIEQLYQDFNADAESWQKKLSYFTDLSIAVDDIANAAIKCRYVYDSMKQRMQQFIFVFIGLGDTGKTSLICDLANKSPAQLNAMLRKLPDFDPADDIKVQKGMATAQIYDIHITDKNIRLIDFPGHSGLVHENAELARLLDLADCHVYVLSAATSLSKSDVDFLREQVAMIDKGNPFKHQPGSDRTIVLAWNRWITEYEKHSEAAVEKEWRKISEYALHGRSGEFPGLAETFSPAPYVIKTNSRRRDENGEPFKGEELYIEELIRLFSEVSSKDGVIVRLKRPLQLMSRTLAELGNSIRYRRLALLPSGEVVFQPVVENLKERSKGVRAANLEQLPLIGKQLTPQLIGAFERAAGKWNPPSSFGASLRTVVPIPKLRCGPTAVTKEIGEKWANSFRQVFAAEIEESGIGKFLENALRKHGEFVIREMMPDLSGLGELDLQRVSEGIRKEMAARRSQSRGGQLDASHGAFQDINDQMNQLVEACVEKVLKEQLVVLTGGLFLDMILAKLTLGLTTAFAVCVRWFRSHQQDEAAKYQVQQQGADAIGKVIAKLNTDLVAAYDASQREIEKLVLMVIDAETESKDESRNALLSVISEIEALKERVSETYDQEVVRAVA